MKYTSIKCAKPSWKLKFLEFSVILVYTYIYIPTDGLNVLKTCSFMKIRRNHNKIAWVYHFATIIAVLLGNKLTL